MLVTTGPRSKAAIIHLNHRLRPRHMDQARFAVQRAAQRSARWGARSEAMPGKARVLAPQPVLSSAEYDAEINMRSSNHLILSSRRSTTGQLAPVCRAVAIQSDRVT
jgi:hypothetical protein